MINAIHEEIVAVIRESRIAKRLRSENNIPRNTAPSKNQPSERINPPYKINTANAAVMVVRRNVDGNADYLFNQCAGTEYSPPTGFFSPIHAAAASAVAK